MQGNDGVGCVKVNSVLLQTWLAPSQAGLEPTPEGYQVDLPLEALRCYLYFLYTGQLQHISATVQSELRLFAQRKNIPKLVEVSSKTLAKGKANNGETALKGLAIREALERSRKSSEAPPISTETVETPAAAAVIADEEEAKRVNIEEAMRKMREYKQSMAEKREKMLQGLGNREADSEPMQVEVEAHVEEREPVQEDTQETAEEEKRRKRAKILEALEKRK